jgi:hypothetical protein
MLSIEAQVELDPIVLILNLIRISLSAYQTALGDLQQKNLLPLLAGLDAYHGT